MSPTNIVIPALLLTNRNNPDDTQSSFFFKKTVMNMLKEFKQFKEEINT